MEFWGFKNESQYKRAVKSIVAYEGGDGLGESSAANPNNGNQCIVAKLTSRDGTDKRKYAWEHRRGTSTDTEAITGGLSGTTSDRSAYDLSGDKTDHTNGIVVLVRQAVKQGDNSIKVEWVISPLPPLGAVFAVNLSSVSGSSPSFTYTVKDLTNTTTLGTGMSPEFRPFGSLPITSGSKGTGYLNSSGTFVLATADEVVQTVACTLP